MVAAKSMQKVIRNTLRRLFSLGSLLTKHSFKKQSWQDAERSMLENEKIFY